MSAPTTPLQIPPRRTTASGEERRVGVELEMSGLSLERLAQRVAQQQGLALTAPSRYERVLTGDPAGDWIIELDFALLKKMGRESRDQQSVVDELESAAEQILHWGAEQVVPLEVVSPPLTLSRLQEVEALIATLRTSGAQGTAGKLYYAFGLQFNPEVPAEDAATLTDYLRAFLCLYDWLYERAEVNATRRLVAYADPFPRDYVAQVVNPDYRPNLTDFMDDYLHHNPTRNRALDLLPLLRHLDEDRLLRHMDGHLVKARPTFHYRLPNCEIDQPGWGLHTAWNDWVAVERLAEDKPRLQACARAYSKLLAQAVSLPGQWRRELEQQWLV